MYNIYTMATPANLYKLTVFSEMLGMLQDQTHMAQTKIIKAAGEEDLRLMRLSSPLHCNWRMPCVDKDTFHKKLARIKSVDSSLKTVTLHT